MSATARDYTYVVKMKREAQAKPEPTVSVEKLKAYQADVAKYLAGKDGATRPDRTV